MGGRKLHSEMQRSKKVEIMRIINVKNRKSRLIPGVNVT
jgi:hypothetical protein